MSSKDDAPVESGPVSGGKPEPIDLTALDHPVVLSFIFHPRKDQSPVQDNPGVQEHLFTVGDDIVIGSKLFISDRQDPVVLYFHGNGEIASDYDEIAPFYTQRGLNLFIFDYRGYGRSSGEPTLSSMIRDSRALFPLARERLISEGFHGSLWVMGRSLGSASAIEIGYHNQSMVEGLIVESGFADALGLLARVGVPVKMFQIPEALAQFNLVSIRSTSLPTLIIHGEWDQIIPVSEGQALYDASGASKKEMLIIPRAGHNDLFWAGFEQYMDAIQRFVLGQSSG